MKSGGQWFSVVLGTALMGLPLSRSEAQTWNMSSPGAGGAFTCADVSANGTVLVGSDLSGLYKRTAPYDWVRIGHSDGINATAVDAVRWEPGSNSVALAGTRNGLYRTTNGGSSWSVVAGPWDADDDVSAIGWSTTNNNVYVATVHAMSNSNCPAEGDCDGAQADSLKLVWLWKSTNDGASFSSYTHGIPAGRRIIKILVDPKVSDGEKVYIVSGRNQGPLVSKEAYLTDNNSTFWKISGDYYAIDVAVDSTHNELVLMTTSDGGPGEDDNIGTIQMSTDDGANWDEITDLTTGAIWFNGGVAYVLNVQQDACSGSPERAGKFLFASGDDWETAVAVAISREDDGIATEDNTASWDLGWTDCKHARGRALNSVAFSLSARGEYWVTPQFVWRHNASGDHKYENAFTTITSGTYQTKGIDNSNPWVVAMGNNTSTIWAGYHDLGIWKSTDDGIRWINKNPDLDPNTNGWDGKGGNVSSIAVSGGDTVFAAMAENDDPESDKTYSYFFKLYRTTDGGDNWSLHGNLGMGFIYSLHKNVGTGRMWATKDGDPYASDDRGATWFLVDSTGFPTDGIFVVTTFDNSGVLAGGWAGLWRSTDNGSNWAEVTSGSDFDFSDEGDDKGDLDKLNRVSWHGIHQILVDESVWVVSYAKYNYSPCTTPCIPANRGIWRSNDFGASFASLTWQTGVTDTVVRRGIAVDSCSRRIHITSGTPHTGGINNTTALNRASGKLTCPLDASGNFVYSKCKVDAVGAGLRYRFGGAVIASGSNEYVYVAVPGNGLMRQTVETGGQTPCETQLGGGEGMRARQVREEHSAPKVEQTLYALKDAYDLEFYDLSGRKVKVTKPGVYFERRELPGKVTRRTVVVTP